MTAVYAIVEATSHGWTSTYVLGFGAVAAVLMAAFLRVEARIANPIMPLRILRLRGLVGSSVVRGFLVTAMYSTFFLGTLYLEHVRHYSALRTGLSFMPLLTIAMADVPAADAGLGSGIVNVSQQVSGALGIAVLGTIATNHTKALEAHGQSLTSGLLGGYHLAFLIGAGSAVVGILVALVVLRARPAAAPESVKDGEPAFIGEPEPELERQAA